MELTVGQKAYREMTVTSEMVAAYAEVTGGYNPLHFDNGFVSRTRFKRLIAQGGITTELLHALVAMDMPGPGMVFRRAAVALPQAGLRRGQDPRRGHGDLGAREQADGDPRYRDH